MNETIEQQEEGEMAELLANLSHICTVVMVTMCLVGIVFNSLSLYIYTSKAFRRRSINVLLAALSAADCGVCILAIPSFSLTQMQSMIPEYMSINTLGHVLFIVYPITLMLQSMSVWFLVYITVDRYLAVCHPFTAHVYSSRRRAVGVVTAIVVFSILYNVVRFWEFRPHPTEIVEPRLRANQLFMLLYQNIATLITQFVLPLFVLGVLNLEVARTILRARETRRELVASEKREHCTAEMMLFVVIVFIVCYTFSFILNVAELLDEEKFRQPVGHLLNDVNNILIVLNSSSSFIFYCIYSSRFRSRLRALCCVRWFAVRYARAETYDRTLSSRFSYRQKRLSAKPSECVENITLITT